MQTATKVMLGVAAGALAIGTVAALASRPDRADYPDPDEPMDPGPYPGGDTGPGDAPLSMPVRGQVDPPGWWDEYGFDGSLEGTRIEATIDPRGWWNEIGARGHVDSARWDVQLDPPGWGGQIRVTGQRTSDGYRGQVDPPGPWNEVPHTIRESYDGARVLRDGRFEQRLVPSWSEAVWRSYPTDASGGARQLEFDPPGWSNTTRVTLEGNPPAGVEATIAAHLYDRWQQQMADDAADAAEVLFEE